MSGALLCAMAMGLWPTRALADDWVNVTQSEYWCLSYTDFASFTASDLSINPSSSTNAGLDTLLTADGAYGSPAGLNNNKTAYVMASVSSGALTQGMQFRLAPTFGNLTCTDSTVSAGVKVGLSPTQYKYYGRRSGGSWIELTPSNGLFTAPYQLTLVAVACNARGSGNANGYAKVYGFGLLLSVYTYSQQPDVVSAIEEQTQVITSVTENQTEELKDTTGSGTIASGALSQGQDMYQNFSVNQLVDTVSGDIRQAVYSTDSDSAVTFPGMTLMGFTIPSVSIDPMTQLPVIADTVRLIVTFTFSAAFLRHIIELLHAIFGIYDYGDSAEMFGDSEKSSNNVFEG